MYVVFNEFLIYILISDYQCIIFGRMNILTSYLTIIDYLVIWI